MSKLLITIEDIAKLSGFDGNIDNDSINPFIFMAQDSEIQRILGAPLYDKIVLDYNNDALAGNYKILYDKYIAICLAYFTCSFYLQLGIPKVSQNGAYLVTPEKTEQIYDEKSSKMAGMYEKMAVKKELDMIEFLDSVNLPERPAPSDIKAKSNFPWIKVK
jgi:hypothetical protein